MDRGSQLRQGLASVMARWRSIELSQDVRYTSLVAAPAEPGAVSQSEHHYRYIETRAGERLSEVTIRDAHGRLNVTTKYCDGNRFATATSKEHNQSLEQTLVTFNRAFGTEAEIGGSEKPDPLIFFQVEKKPLSQSLERATDLGSCERLGRECETYLFRQVKWTYKPTDLKFIIDRATATPVEVRGYPDERAVNDDRPEWVWAAQSLDQVGDYFFPKHWTSTTYKAPAKGEEAKPAVGVNQWVGEVKQIEFDKDYAHTLFWPTAEPGTMVWDQVKNTHHFAPGGKASPAPVKAQAVHVEPLRAEPPRDWMQTGASLGLALGVAIMLVGLILWKRRG